MEIFDLYDIDRNLINKQLVRGDKRNKDEYYLVVHCGIFNSQGEMLIQHRQSFKSNWSGLWDLTCGGHAQSGESSREAIRRELKEELGISYDFTDVRPYFTMNWQCGFDDFYLLQKDLDIDSLKLQYEEVQEVKWADLDEILKMIDVGEFIPYHKALVILMFENIKQFGCQSIDD